MCKTCAHLGLCCLLTYCCRAAFPAILFFWWSSAYTHDILSANERQHTVRHCRTHVTAAARSIVNLVILQPHSVYLWLFMFVATWQCVCQVFKPESIWWQCCLLTHTLLYHHKTCLDNLYSFEKCQRRRALYRKLASIPRLRDATARFRNQYCGPAFFPEVSKTQDSVYSAFYNDFCSHYRRPGYQLLLNKIGNFQRNQDSVKRKSFYEMFICVATRMHFYCCALDIIAAVLNDSISPRHSKAVPANCNAAFAINGNSAAIATTKAGAHYVHTMAHHAWPIISCFWMS